MYLRVLFVSLFVFIAFACDAQFRVFQRSAKGKVKTIEKTTYLEAVYESGKWVVKDSGKYEHNVKRYNPSGAVTKETVSARNEGTKDTVSRLEIEYIYTNNNLTFKVYHKPDSSEQVADVEWIDATEYRYSLNDDVNEMKWDYVILLDRKGYLKRRSLKQTKGKHDPKVEQIVTEYSYNEEYNLTEEVMTDMKRNNKEVYKIEIPEKDSEGNPLMTVAVSDKKPEKAKLTYYRYTYY